MYQFCRGRSARIDNGLVRPLGLPKNSDLLPFMSFQILFIHSWTTLFTALATLLI